MNKLTRITGIYPAHQGRQQQHKRFMAMSETTQHILRILLRFQCLHRQSALIKTTRSINKRAVHYCVSKSNQFAYKITNIYLVLLNRVKCHLPKHFQAKQYLLKCSLLRLLPPLSKDKLDTARIPRKKDLALWKFIQLILTQNNLSAKVFLVPSPLPQEDLTAIVLVRIMKSNNSSKIVGRLL